MSESVLEVPARRKYVVTGDLRGLMRRWAEPKGFVLPGRRFFSQIEEALVVELRRIFEPRSVEVQFIPFNWIQRGLSDLIEEYTKKEDLPVISLDRVYVPPDMVDEYFDTTRIVKHSKHEPSWEDQWRDKVRVVAEDGSDEEVELHGPRCGYGSILSQLDRITRLEAIRDKKRVRVVDDGIWSCASLGGVEQLLSMKGVKVETFLVAIWTKQKPAKPEETSEAQTKKKKYSLIAPVIAVPAWDFEKGVVYDWVCARDFCLGAPLSGKTLGEEVTDFDPRDTVLRENFRGIPMEGNYGAPYMVPLGHARSWARIPAEELKAFSRFCLRQSLTLYRAIERQTKETTKEPRAVRVSDLDRPPYFYRSKRDSPVAREIEISLEILEKMNL